MDEKPGPKSLCTRRNQRQGWHGIFGGAANGNKTMHHHVLEVGLDEVSLLVRGIDEGVSVDDEI